MQTNGWLPITAMRALIETTNDAIVITEPEPLSRPGPRITYANPAFCRLAGYGANEIIGKTPRILQGPATDRHALDRIGEALRAGLGCREEIQNYAKDGSPYWLDIHIIPLLDEDGAIRYFGAIERDVTARRQNEDDLYRLANIDSLTSLANRLQFERSLEKYCVSGQPFVVLLLDLDHFKNVNDTLGHPCGDQLLVEVSRRMEQTMRDSDTIARLGGDEFAIIARGSLSSDTIKGIAERLRSELTKPFVIDGHTVAVGVSVGIARAPKDGHTPKALMQASDIALYKAKHAGRNTFCFFDGSMADEIKEQQNLDSDLRKAIAEKDFVAHYQPIVNAATLEVEGYEALVRWPHPTKGMISPMTFIPAAEAAGLIVAIDCLVMRKACHYAMTLANDVYVSINASPIDLRDATFLEAIRAVLAETELPPARLQLEITENVVLEADPNTLNCLHQLRAMGASIAMDDFGSGYSSLSNLCNFPFTRIKVDRSLIKNIAIDQKSQHVVKSVVFIADGLGMSVTAEGVETQEQLAAVRAVGCHQVQGYLTGRPLPPEHR